MAANSLKIDGTYGDPVNLQLKDGYIATKYSDIARIKSVDIESSTVYTYAHGSFDFSRISSSWKSSKAANKEYLDEVYNFFKRQKIKIGTVLNILSGTYVIKEIISPDMINEFIHKILLQNIENELDIQEIEITDFCEFNRYFKIVSYPTTLEERLVELLESHSDYARIKDKDLYIKDLLKLIEKEKI